MATFPPPPMFHHPPGFSPPPFAGHGPYFPMPPAQVPFPPSTYYPQVPHLFNEPAPTPRTRRSSHRRSASDGPRTILARKYEAARRNQDLSTSSTASNYEPSDSGLDNNYASSTIAVVNDPVHYPRMAPPFHHAYTPPPPPAPPPMQTYPPTQNVRAYDDTWGRSSGNHTVTRHRSRHSLPGYTVTIRSSDEWDRRRVDERVSRGYDPPPRKTSNRVRFLLPSGEVEYARPHRR